MAKAAISYVIGVDYGTDSVRSVIVDTAQGKEIASAVEYYPRWKAGEFCNPAKNQFRQHPLDYIDGLEKTITSALAQAPKGTAEKIKGISVDTTGSTPVAVNKNGVPLALTKEFAKNPNAMFILWKDHTAVAEAAEINTLAKSWAGEDFTKFVGGIYSSEWFWAKVLHVLREDRKVRDSAFSWVEHCDWIPALLVGNNDAMNIKRSRCSAGHKAMWHPSFGGLPHEEFLIALDPVLKGLRDRLYSETYTSDVACGTLCPEWAKRLGLSESVIIGVGAFDAHMGAVGGEIEPYILSKVMGTSTCDMLVAPTKDIGNKLIRGICGQVDGSIIPGMLGMEAGQSAFGDVYAWFVKMLLKPVETIVNNSEALGVKTKKTVMAELTDSMIPLLTREARKIPIGESGIIALDWLNGRRTPDANQALTGALIGLSLGSDAPKIFRALVEATAFGAKKIVDRFISEGVLIQGVIALGGVAKKSPFVMQTVADVLNMPIRVARSEQACALGAAMFAAVAAGIYADVGKAQKAMGSGFEKEYLPIKENVVKYHVLYEAYSRTAAFVEKEISR
jgi:L-ribulokinase